MNTGNSAGIAAFNFNILVNMADFFGFFSFCFDNAILKKKETKKNQMMKQWMKINQFIDVTTDDD